MHGVEGFLGTGEMAASGDAAAARLAKVDVTGQLADDEDVQAGHQFALQAGSIDQLRIADGGAEVGEQAEMLAQAQNRLLRAQRPVKRVVFPVANSAEQDGVGLAGQLDCGLGQRVAVGVKGRAADQRRFAFKFQVECLEHLDGLGDDFGANAITGKNCYFHGYYLFYSY